MYQKLIIPPGVNRDLTQYALENGGWRGTFNVRFRAGLPEKIGGWRPFLPENTPLVGVPRTIHIWRTLEGLVLTAFATESHVYVYRNGEVIDITPLRKTSTAAANPFRTMSKYHGIIEVTDLIHEAHEGDYIEITGATDGDGISRNAINGVHRINRLLFNSTSIYYIDVKDNATAGGVSFGGARVKINYYLETGLVEDQYATGWGVCQWNRSSSPDLGWGDPRYCDDIIIPGRLWSMDNWGQDLVFNPWGGKVYKWLADNPHDRGVWIEKAPSKVQFIKVTDSRHLACFGCNYDPVSKAAGYAPPNVDPDDLDTLRIQWSDAEDYDFWDIGTHLTDKNAGDYRLTGGSQIISAAKIDTIMMVWTEESAHLMQSVDVPFIFRFDQIGTSTGIIAPNAWAVHNGILMWMGDAAFYTYQGGVSPVVCPVEEHLFKRLNYMQRRKVFAALDRRNDEFIWYYPVNFNETTQLLKAVAPRDTEIHVETTAGFRPVGALEIDNKLFKYSGKTDTKFLDCTDEDGSPISSKHEVGATVDDPEVESTEPSRYVAFSLKDQVWWIGKMTRTAWADRGMIEYPIAARDDGHVFEHDVGHDANGEPLVSAIESCDFDIGEGDALMFIRRFVPDFEMKGKLDVQLRTRYFPQSAQVHEFIGEVEPTTEYINTRIRGRQASFNIKSTGLGDDWRLGACRLDVQPDGRKD